MTGKLSKKSSILGKERFPSLIISGFFYFFTFSVDVEAVRNAVAVAGGVRLEEVPHEDDGPQIEARLQEEPPIAEQQHLHLCNLNFITLPFLSSQHVQLRSRLLQVSKQFVIRIICYNTPKSNIVHEAIKFNC
jgi:hypothetical protein